MSKPIIISRLLLGTKHLGDILHKTDKEGRGYLKLSLKDKVADLVVGSTVLTTSPVPLKLSYPVKLELSYKFVGDVFSIKMTPDGAKPSYQFHQVSVPPTTCLFYLRIKDWQTLEEDDGTSANPLVLDVPPEATSIAVVFSFLSNNGQPPAPPEYSNMLMGVIDVPEKPLSKFCIGVAPDLSNQSTNGVEVFFPFPMSEPSETDPTQIAE